MDNALSIRDAAARAEVTEKTVRRWIKAGRLHAVKMGGQYRITVADLETARTASPDTDVHHVRDTSTQRPDTGHDSPSVDMSERLDRGQGRQQVEPFDIKPLVDHIANLESQVQQLTEVSTMWQFRAHQLEDRIKQLAAGEIVPQTVAEPPESTQTSDPAPRRVLLWLRRLLGSEGRW